MRILGSLGIIIIKPAFIFQVLCGVRTVMPPTLTGASQGPWHDQ